jgi:hypothetical protein
MKALSVRQPWASLIAEGAKTIELRRWKTAYRGPLLICASAHKQGSGPKGVAIAIVDLVGIRPATIADAGAACCEPADDEFAWVLDNPRFVTPFPVKGKLSLFDVVCGPLELHKNPPSTPLRDLEPSAGQHRQTHLLLFR